MNGQPCNTARNLCGAQNWDPDLAQECKVGPGSARGGSCMARCYKLAQNSQAVARVRGMVTWKISNTTHGEVATAALEIN